MPKQPTQKTVDDAIAALDSVRRQWLRRPGVTAVDVGFKIRGDVLTEDVALRVHVTRKLPVAELAKSDVFNESGKTPKRIGGFPVDVIEANYGPGGVRSESTVLDYDNEDATAALERTTTFDPLLGGISCGNPRITAGTIGAIVYNRSTCKPMILSNWHVLAGASAAAVGENIVQPGQLDGGTQAVATLTAMRLDSRMDAAVATLNGNRAHTRDILGLGVVTGIDTPTLGMLVVKSGRTTGITRGVVDGVSLSTSIDYGDPGVVAFSNQIRIVPRPPWPGVDYEVSRGGDSGSVWLNEANNRAIGLHFAGETDPMPSSENAICSPIGPIAAELDFSFLPVLCVKRPPFDLCDLIPWLCEPKIKWPPFKFPFPDPPFPPFPPFPPDPPPWGDLRLGDLTNLLRRGRPQQTTGGCGCSGGSGGGVGGGGGEHASEGDASLAMLAALVVAYLQQGS